jgi:hypothetical protein
MAYSKRGAAALKKQSSADTPVRPDTFFELLSKSGLDVDAQIVSSSPLKNSRSKNQRANKGKINAPSGTIKFTAEPKTIGHFLNGIYGEDSVSSGTAGSTTYYTHVWTETLSAAAIPIYTLDFYQYDIGTRGLTERYYGCRFGQLMIDENNGVLEGSVSIMAQGAFIVEEIGTATTATGTTVILSKTAGLTTSDTLILGWGTANEEEVTISNINADGVTLTVSATANNHAQGDRCVIKPQTASFTLGKQFTFYGGTTTGSNALQGGGSKMLYGATLGAATNVLYIESFGFDFGQELEARHAAGGYTHTDSYPRVILQKGYEATVKFSQYFQSPEFQNVVRRREPIAAIFEAHAGNIDSAATNLETLKIEMPEIYIKPHAIDLGEDEILNEQMEAVIYSSASNGFVTRFTVVNTVADF